MQTRIFALLALVILLGFATRAFGQGMPTDVTDNRPITRVGAVALFVESNPALKSRLSYHIKHPARIALFDDLDLDEWYVPYLETAFEAGVITGNGEGTFRPGSYLKDEEAIVLASRFHALSHPEIMAELSNANDSWINAAVTASSHANIRIPMPVRLGEPVKRGDLYAMMSSMNISNPSQIALSYNPNPAPVAAVPAVPSPVVAQVARPIAAPAYRPPVPAVQRTTPVVVAQQAPVAPAAPAVSQTAFSISMPTLGISNLAVSHPADPFTKNGLLAPLKYGVGHLFSYPGKQGKILIYGHSSSYAWDVSKFTKIFRQINKLNVGDTIYVTYGGSVRTYKVSYKQTVEDTDMSAYQGGNSEELILYTCWPPDSIDKRYLVHAVPVTEVAQR